MGKEKKNRKMGPTMKKKKYSIENDKINKDFRAAIGNMFHNIREKLVKSRRRVTEKT